MTGEPLMTLVGHQGYIWSIAISPDGTRIASGATDMTIRVWDAVSGRLLDDWVATEDNVAPLRVAFSPDGTQVLSAGYDGAVRLWETASGRLLAILPGTAGPVGPVCVQPRRGTGSRRGPATTRFASGIRTWLRRVATLVGHEAPVNSIAFSPDGGSIVLGIRRRNAAVVDRRCCRIPAQPRRARASGDPGRDRRRGETDRLRSKGRHDSNLGFGLGAASSPSCKAADSTATSNRNCRTHLTVSSRRAGSPRCASVRTAEGSSRGLATGSSAFGMRARAKS